VAELLDRGVYGIAVVGGIARAADPGRATEDYLRALDRAGAPCA
jgi:thiamine monophosphate synthase